MALTTDMKIIYNGVDLTQQDFFRVYVDKESAAQIFAPNKNINTTKMMYARRNIITSLQTEPLSFSLIFSPIDKAITNSMLQDIFKIFDVNTYKPLRFGDNEMYFNVMPCVGSISELHIFLQDMGYIEIPFVCDAGHGWIDKEFAFSRNSSTTGITWEVENVCNIKDNKGSYKVYPYIQITVPADTDYVSFGVSTQISGNDGWLTLENISDNQIIVIDGVTRQMRSSAGDNLLNCVSGDVYFPYVGQGKNTLYHRNRTGSTSYYDIDFKLHCPYLGNMVAQPEEDGFLITDTTSVLAFMTTAIATVYGQVLPIASSSRADYMANMLLDDIHGYGDSSYTCYCHVGIDTVRTNYSIFSFVLTSDPEGTSQIFNRRYYLYTDGRADVFYTAAYSHAFSKNTDYIPYKLNVIELTG